MRSWLSDLSPFVASDDAASMHPNETPHPHPHEAADSQVPLSRPSTAEPSYMTESKRNVGFHGRSVDGFCDIKSNKGFRIILPTDFQDGELHETMDKLLHNIIDILKGHGIVPTSVKVRGCVLDCLMWIFLASNTLKPLIDQLHWRTKNQSAPATTPQLKLDPRPGRTFPNTRRSARL